MTPIAETTRRCHWGPETAFRGPSCLSEPAGNSVRRGYSALAANPSLEAAGYPLTIALQVRKALPVVGAMLTDKIADVVNYIRSHSGTSHTDFATVHDVKGFSQREIASWSIDVKSRCTQSCA